MQSDSFDQPAEVDESAIDRQFPYRSRLWKSLLAFLFAGGLAVFLLNIALTDAGDFKFKSIRLHGTAATVARWVVFAVLAAVSAFTASNLAKRLLFPNRRIALTPDGIVMPRSNWSASEDYLAFTTITDFEAEEKAGKWGMMHMTGFRFRSNRKSYQLNFAELPEDAQEEIGQRLVLKGGPEVARAVAAQFWSKKATRIELDGNWEEALEIHQWIVTTLPGSPEAAYAQKCIERIRTKQGSN